MNTKLTLLLVVLLPLAAHAADDLSTALQKGLFEEEANQNLPAAIKAYESLLAASDEQRKLAATALFRLGECYRKLGLTNDAVAQYQRLLRDYADQGPLATLSRQNLRGLGVGTATAPIGGGPVQLVASAEAEELARTERILAQLSGWDLGQVRRLLPTLVPDADFELHDRLLTEAQEKVRSSNGEEQAKWVQSEDQYTVRLRYRFDEVKRILQERIEALRAHVRQQTVEASRLQTGTAADPAHAAVRKAEAAQAEALLKHLQPMSRQELVRVLPTVAPDALLNSLLEQLSQAERKRAELKPSFADGHPEVKAVEATLKLLNQQIAERIDGIMKGLEIKAAAARQAGRESVEP